MIGATGAVMRIFGHLEDQGEVNIRTELSKELRGMIINKSEKAKKDCGLPWSPAPPAAARRATEMNPTQKLYILVL